MNDDDIDEIEMAHRARLRAVLEADDLRAEVERLANLLRLAEASVSLLRGDVDAARLELCRLRAAEAPGTDDEAVAPWEWHAASSSWRQGALSGVVQVGRRWCVFGETATHVFALDAMRAAVPGSL